MARKKENPEMLRARAKKLMEKAEQLENGRYEEIGRSFAVHIDQNFKNFDLETFTKESKAILHGTE